MPQGLISSILSEAVAQIFTLALPLLGTAMVIGLIVSIFQATTSIQEQTLTFVPKLVVILLVLLFMAPFFYNSITDFIYHVFDLIGTASMQ